MTKTLSITEVIENTIYEHDNPNYKKFHRQQVSSGFKELDKRSGGYYKGELSIIASRPGMGKSSFSLSSAYYIANQKITVGYISTERTPLEILYHITAVLSKTPTSALAYGYTWQTQLRKLSEVKDQMIIPLLLSRNRTYDIEDVFLQCKEFIDNGAEIIFIDCIQNLESYYEGDHLVSEKSGNSNKAFSIIERLNKFAIDNNVAVVITSQIALDVEWRGGDKKPYLHDLKWAGYLEDIAATVFLVYRAEYYDLIEDEYGESTKGLAEILIVKNKLGYKGECIIKYDAETKWFTDHPH